MSITSIKRDWGVSPSIVRITSTDDLATITTAGYLNSERSNILEINDGDFQWEVGDLILIYYFDNQWSFFSRDSSNDLTVVISGGSGDVQPFNIQQQTYSFADDDGIADAYHADYTPAIGAYVKGMRLTFSTVNANTGSSTFAVNGLGPIPIVFANGDPLGANDIPADSIVDVILRDDGDWQLMSASPSSGSSVTPQEIQNQVFIFAPDESGVPDAYVVTLSPVPNIQDGTFIRTSVNSTNTGASTLTINGNTYDIALNDGLFSDPIAGDMIASALQDFQIFNSSYAVLMNPAVSSASSVTPEQIQNQTFVYGVASGTADAITLTVTALPTVAYVDGMAFEFKAPGNNTITNPTINVNGLGAVQIVGSDNGPLLPGALLTTGTYRITFNATYGFVLHNSARGTSTSAQLAQQMFFQSSAAGGVVNAYTATFAPAITFYQDFQLFMITIPGGLTNTSTSVTFDAGNGALPVRLSSGALPAIGDIVAGGTYFLTVTDSAGGFQLLNPTLSNGGALPQVVGSFTPSLLNYTLNGGTGLVATGNYVSTGANLFISAFFTNPGGTIDLAVENGNFSNFPLDPVQTAQALLTSGVTEFEKGTPYNATVPNTGDLEGLVTIVEGSTRYLVGGMEDNNEVYVFQFDITSTAPGFQLTAVGGSQATAFNMGWMDTFVYSGTTYIIGVDRTTNKFTTVSFSAGVISAVTSTDTTASNPNTIQQFFYSGTQYCSVFKLDGNLETFSFDGSTWTSVDDLTIGAASDSQPFYIAPIGGVPYLVNANNDDELAKTWSWNGSAWVTAAADVAFTTAASIASFALFDFSGDTFFVLGSGDSIELYLWSAGWVFQQTIGTSNVWSVTPFVRDGVAYVQVFDDSQQLAFYTLFYDTTSSLISYLTFSIATASFYFGQTVVFNDDPVTYSFGASRSDNNLGAYAITPIGSSETILIETDGIGYLDGVISEATSILINATYQTVGLTSINFPNSVVQNFSTFFAPFSFSPGTDQVYDFDAIVGPAGPVTYSAGTFTFPGDAPRTWEIIGQFYAPTDAMDNMRLHISSPFAVDFYYTAPVLPATPSIWTYINWRGQIATAATMQLLYDASSSGTIDNGSGVWQGITSFMTIRQI